MITYLVCTLALNVSDLGSHDGLWPDVPSGFSEHGSFLTSQCPHLSQCDGLDFCFPHSLESALLRAQPKRLPLGSLSSFCVLEWFVCLPSLDGELLQNRDQIWFLSCSSCLVQVRHGRCSQFHWLNSLVCGFLLAAVTSYLCDSVAGFGFPVLPLPHPRGGWRSRRLSSLSAPGFLLSEETFFPEVS